MRGPAGGPPRTGGQPTVRGGQPNPAGGPRRPAAPGGPGGAQSTQKIAKPGESTQKSQATQKIGAGTLGEAMAQRTPRSGAANRSGPAGSRPGSGPGTGSRRAVGGTPPSGPPPRKGNGGGGGNGPGGKGPKAKKKSPWRIVRRVIYVLVALAIVVPSAVFLIAYTTVSVPQPGDLKTNQVATILASDGTSVISKIVPPQGNRTDVTIDQIPPQVRNAVIAAEDRDFYSNPGFSISGFVRAARDNVLGKESAGGGSTITQQYVKNSMVGNQHSLSRKMRELVISAKMARQWSKNDILTAYLNTIPFGRGTFGIDAAAHAYFDKKVEDLTVEEGAMLAATIQQPYGLDPENNPKGAEARWNYVLDGMVASGNLPAADRTKMVYPKVQPSSSNKDDSSPQEPGSNGLIKRQVMQELADAGISDTQINKEGLQITTTIDQKAQQAAVDSVHKNMQGERDEVRTAVVSVDPKTGAVRAYYGGDDGQGWDYANAGLQSGSTFKVFGLAENLELGKPLSTMYDSSDLTVNGIKITNAEGETCGTCTIAEALKRSLNTSFYRMELDMPNGPAKIAAMAHKMGIPDSIPGVGQTLTEPDGSGPNNGIILGQYQVRPLDMASAYGTIAASGMYHKPHFVDKVVTADGQVLLDRGQVAGEQRISSAVADNLTSAMQPIAASSRNHGLAGGRLSGSKTGTTQLGDTGQNKDAWMIGFTPSLSTAVWVGTADGVALKTSGGAIMYGSGLPSDIWKDTMDGALEGTPKETFPKPAAIGGQAGVPSFSAPYTAPSTTQEYQPPVVVKPSQVEILPGITIPVPGLQPNPRGQQPQNQPQAQDSGPMPGQPVAPADGSSPSTAESGDTSGNSRSQRPGANGNTNTDGTGEGYSNQHR
ncbi:transglycosylase domain-containing protein [Nocardia spumae]|uniref:transglycosylase domain-containing protein n=1 Tax=Nocardia spumae TaxID=2887190 RepID=UPI001D14BA8E|nr:transglycosylase domain-containing protein [Nocardia spumae]